MGWNPHLTEREAVRQIGETIDAIELRVERPDTFETACARFRYARTVVDGTTGSDRGWLSDSERSRVDGKAEFTKHLIRMRHAAHGIQAGGQRNHPDQ
jgi:hypothetical protein